MQALDVGLFAIHNAAMGKVCTSDWLTTQSKRGYCILGASQAAATAPHIIIAFTQVGIHMR
jgi:hypothetical protein